MGIRLVNRSPRKLDGGGDGGPEDRAAQGGVGGLSVFRAAVAPQSLEEYVQDKRSALVKENLSSNHTGSPRLRLAFKVGVSSLPLPTLPMSLATACFLLPPRPLSPPSRRASPPLLSPLLINHTPCRCLSSVCLTFSATHSPTAPLASTALPSPSLPPFLPPVLPRPVRTPSSPPPYLSLVRLHSCLLLSAGRIAMSSAADAADQEGGQSDIWVLPQVLGV